MTNVVPSTGNSKDLSISAEAAQAAMAALEQNPDDHAAMHAVALAKYGSGEAQDALDLIVKANQLCPSNPTYCVSLGRILAKEQMHNQATLAYLAAQELDPENPVILTELAESLLALGKKDEAKVVIEAATSLYRDRLKATTPSTTVLPGVSIAKARLTLSGIDFESLRLFGDVNGTSFIGQSTDGQAFIKIEVRPNPNKKWKLSGERQLIEELNKAGCMTCPRLIDHGQISRVELEKVIDSQGTAALGTVAHNVFDFMIQQFIPATESPSLGDLLLAVLEQKALGVFHADLRIENCRMDASTGVCTLVDYDQAERLDEQTRTLDNMSFFEWCDDLVRQKYAQWGFKSFLHYFPKIDPKQVLAAHFPNGSFNLATTRLFTNQITTAAKAGIYHTIREKEFFIEGERTLDSRRGRLDQVEFSPGERVLDVGCSSGIISTYLARRGCTVTGVDLDPEIIRGCKILANILGTRTTFYHHDLDTGPVPGTFDTVLLFSVIHHTKRLVENAKAIAEQCGRIIIECRLQEGGLKPVGDGRWQKTSGWNFANQSELIAALEELFPGFRLSRDYGVGDRDRFMMELRKVG